MLNSINLFEEKLYDTNQRIQSQFAILKAQDTRIDDYVYKLRKEFKQSDADLQGEI